MLEVSHGLFYVLKELKIISLLQTFDNDATTNFG